MLEESQITSEIKRKAGIGKGLGPELIAEAREVLEAAPAAEPFYLILDHFKKAVAFEILQKRDVTKKVVDSWLQNRDNVARVAAHRKKAVPEDVHDVVDGWAAFRVRKGKHPPFCFSKPGQTVVLIAIKHWNEENGFFMHDVAMDPGEDINLDGGEFVHIAQAGGVLLVWINLDLPAINMEVPTESSSLRDGSQDRADLPLRHQH